MEHVKLVTKDTDCCRTCLENTSILSYDIFTSISGHQVNAADVLAMCTSVKVDKEDGFPKKLCRSCYNFLESFYSFKNLAEKIDMQLKQQLQNRKNDVLEEEIGGEDKMGIKVELEQISCNNNDDDDNISYAFEENCKSIVKEENTYLDETNDSLLCNICMDLFETVEDLSIHLRSHENDKDVLTEFKCVVCQKKFKTNTKFQQHMSKHNPENITCNKTNSKKSLEVETNNKEVQNLRCDICSLSFKSTNSMAAHMRKHVKKGRVLACSICAKSFIKVSHLKRHELGHKNRLQKQKDRVLECSICGKVFKKASHVKRHEVVHAVSTTIPQNNAADSLVLETIKQEEVDLECDVCSTHFTSMNSLAAHMRKHVKKNRVLACSICGKVFKKVSHVKRHELCHDVNRPFQCTLCPKRFHSQTLLTEHLDKHKRALIKPHVCPVCNKAFSDLTTLTKHIKIHTRGKPFLCPTCGKRFDSSTNLNQHVRRHLGLKLFACDMCPRKFVSKGEQKSHATTHTGERSWTCDQCGSSFTKRSSMVKHGLRHAGIKPHHCDVCPKKFTTKDHLKRHYRIHTGEKPYGCDICGRKFTQSADLLKHKRSHLGDKLYKCTECPESFRLHAQLRRHQSEHFISKRKQPKPPEDSCEKKEMDRDDGMLNPLVDSVANDSPENTVKVVQ